MMRQVVKGGTPVDLVRRGKVVARLVSTTSALQGTAPWLRLRGSGVFMAPVEESVLEDGDFEAMTSDGR